MCDNCKGQISDTFVRGLATSIWGCAWADHVEEHGCYNLSGCEITEHMPEIPEIAYRMAERIMGMIEQANNMHVACLFAAAMQADGKTALEHRHYYDRIAERFGECLGHMAMGTGVCWFDDHNRFDLKVPNCETYGLRVYANETCEEETNRKLCKDCGSYVTNGFGCNNC